MSNNVRVRSKPVQSNEELVKILEDNISRSVSGDMNFNMGSEITSDDELDIDTTPEMIEEKKEELGRFFDFIVNMRRKELGLSQLEPGEIEARAAALRKEQGLSR